MCHPFIANFSCDAPIWMWCFGAFVFLIGAQSLILVRDLPFPGARRRPPLVELLLSRHLHYFGPERRQVPIGALRLL
jgi:hypothetical protein